MRRVLLLAAAGGAYVLAAWLSAPGFYDGFAPAEPYHWVSPPPDLRSGNKPPSGGRTRVTVQNGVAQAGHLSTDDQQAAVTFPSQSFDAPPEGSPINLQIQPVATYPDLGGIAPAGNVYLVTVSTRLISPVVVTLRYGSQQSGPPTRIFGAESQSSGWRALTPVNSSVLYAVAASTPTLGYFVVGFPPAAPRPPGSGSSSGGGGLPLGLVVAVAAGLIVVGSVPLIVLRGRAGERGPELPPAEAPRNLGGARRRGRRRSRR